MCAIRRRQWQPRNDSYFSNKLPPSMSFPSRSFSSVCIRIYALLPKHRRHHHHHHHHHKLARLFIRIARSVFLRSSKPRSRTCRKTSTYVRTFTRKKSLVSIRKKRKKNDVINAMFVENRGATQLSDVFPRTHTGAHARIS